MQVKKQHFKSLHEFYKFITTQPVNSVFKGRSLESKTGTKRFTGTNNFEEAVQLFHKGWPEMAKELEGKLKAKTRSIKNQRTRRNVYDVAGYQASVPRHLMGIPTAMVNQKTVTKKQKVVTVNKSINYNFGVSQNEIINESIKALKIVREIEASGTRVNLNIVWSTISRTGEQFVLTLRLKSANEKLNISKLAFPLVHPSMLRRLMLRWLETNKIITCKTFTIGYGKPERDENFKKLLPQKEIYLPAFIRDEKQIIENL